MFRRRKQFPTVCWKQSVDVATSNSDTFVHKAVTVYQIYKEYEE